MSRDIYILVVMIATAALLVGCGKEGPTGPPGARGTEGPQGPQGLQGVAGKAATAFTKMDSPILRVASVEVSKNTARAACKADEMIVSAVCVGRGNKNVNPEIDVDKRAAQCVRGQLYMVCGKTSAFGSQ